MSVTKILIKRGENARISVPCTVDKFVLFYINKYNYICMTLVKGVISFVGIIEIVQNKTTNKK